MAHIWPLYKKRYFLIKIKCKIVFLFWKIFAKLWNWKNLKTFQEQIRKFPDTKKKQKQR